MREAPPLQTRDDVPLYPADCLAAGVLQQLHELDPQVDIADSIQSIRDIAGEVCERLDATATLGDTLFALNDHLFNVLAFHSATKRHAKPAHNLLHQVLQQREGDALTLGILYICVARWLGVPLEACDFPGRFLVRYRDELGGVVIDPAAGGIQLQRDDLLSLLMHRFGRGAESLVTEGFLSTVDDQLLVVRLLRRLRQAYLKHGDLVQALRVQNQIMQLVPDMPGDFRERGRLYELLECYRAAAEDYSRYLDLMPDARDADGLKQQLSTLLKQPVVLH